MLGMLGASSIACIAGELTTRLLLSNRAAAGFSAVRQIACKILKCLFLAHHD
jgi:hypothetical protein